MHILIARRDPLTAVVRPFPIPTLAALDLSALPLALTSSLDIYRLRLLATHLLIAGASRRGKGSVIWSLIRALASGVHAGLVQLWAIDPKGGVELAFGAPMFTRFAYQEVEHMADLLEEAVAVMRARQRRIVGQARLHTPAIGDPLIVVIIDEIAALTSYTADTALKKRIDAALGILLSQGAGMGVLVVAAIQDPRKETLPDRALFLTRILLGVTDADQITMVLGKGARERGALADKLPASAPGVGYVLVDGTSEPVKVRFTYPTDNDIRAMAATYPAPTQAPSITPSIYIPAQTPREIVEPEPTSTNAHSAASLLPVKLLGYLGGNLNSHQVNGTGPHISGGEK